MWWKHISGNAEAVRAALETEREYINWTRDDGGAALHYAPDAEIAGLLLKSGANTEAPDIVVGAKPLHWAARDGRGDVAMLLLSRGANIEATTRTGLRPLHFAVEAGQEHLVQILLERNADKNAIGGRDSDTPLHLAVLRNSMNLVMMLIRAGGDRDICNGDGLSPVDLARQLGLADIGKYLSRR